MASTSRRRPTRWKSTARSGILDFDLGDPFQQERLTACSGVRWTAVGVPGVPAAEEPGMLYARNENSTPRSKPSRR
jgi:hypothetical protein